MTQPRTIDSLFRHCLEAYPERDFLQLSRPDGPGLRVEATTFAEAAGRIAATVLRLRQVGLAAGDTVVVWADDVSETLHFFLACFHLGVVPVPLAPSFSIDYVGRTGQRVAAAGYFGLMTEAQQLGAAGMRALCFCEAADAPPGVEHLPRRADLPTATALAILQEESSSHGVDDPLIITPTSGSTGEPKLPLWSHRSMERAADNLRLALGWTAQDRARALLANAPTHGLGLTLASGAWIVGAALCVPSRIDVQAPLGEVRELDFSHSFMTPRVLRSLRAQQQAAGQEEARLFGPSARAIAFAGAPPPIELFPLLADQGVAPIDVWGSSETGNIACTERGAWESGKLRLFPGIEVRVGANSELALRSSHFFLGYFGDAEATRQARTEDGFYLSGDAGEVLPDGWLRITGRTRDVFNTFEGSNIWPGRIEQLLEGLPGVAQAVLLGDQRPFCCALIVLREPAGELAVDGVLEPRRHAALYEAARADLQRMNTALEGIEQVRRFLLLGQHFAQEVYASVGAASKVRRDRAAVARVYAARIGELYGPGFAAAACVPVAARTRQG